MLPDFGWTELLMIVMVLIVVVGPKDLPKMLRTFGKTTSNLRRMAGDFRKQFDEALKEAELEDVRSIAKDMKGLDPRNEIKSALNPLSKAGRDINEDLKKATRDLDKPVTPEKTEKPADTAAKTAAKPKAAAKKATTKKAATAKTATKAAAAKSTTAKSTTAKTSTAKTPAAKANGTGKSTPPGKPAARKTTAKTASNTAKPAASKAKAASAGDKS
jgi:sec-independent protein translocase protein TatB